VICGQLRHTCSIEPAQVDPVALGTSVLGQIVVLERLPRDHEVARGVHDDLGVTGPMTRCSAAGSRQLRSMRLRVGRNGRICQEGRASHADRRIERSRVASDSVLRRGRVAGPIEHPPHDDAVHVDPVGLLRHAVPHDHEIADGIHGHRGVDVGGAGRQALSHRSGERLLVYLELAADGTAVIVEKLAFDEVNSLGRADPHHHEVVEVVHGDRRFELVAHGQRVHAERLVGVVAADHAVAVGVGNRWPA